MFAQELLFAGSGHRYSTVIFLLWRRTLHDVKLHCGSMGTDKRSKLGTAFFHQVKVNYRRRHLHHTEQSKRRTQVRTALKTAASNCKHGTAYVMETMLTTNIVMARERALAERYANAGDAATVVCLAHLLAAPDVCSGQKVQKQFFCSLVVSKGLL